MHLYLKNGNQQRWLVINLIDGNIPKIVGLSSPETSLLTDNLEPAIWFKVMLLESVSIDCSTRVVSWTNGKQHEGDSTPTTYSVFGSAASCYDFDDDIDELFTIAMQLIENNPLAELNEVTRKEKIYQFEQSLFRMMHCYILSKIVIQPRDLPCVIKALNTQNKSISQLEDQTLVHSRLAEYYLSQMRSMRESEIAPSIETLIETKMITKELAEILLSDIKKAEALLRQEVDDAQKRVNSLKEDLVEVRSNAEIAQQLSEARQLRDSKIAKLETLIVFRATIHNSVPSLNNISELNISCRHYLSLHYRVLDEKKLLKFFVDQKLRALSVRECIQGVIKDLEKGFESCGEEFTIEGKRTTDVMDGLQTCPEWQTLTQRLSSMIYNIDHPVGQNFKTFYQKLELKCRTVLRSVENSALNSTQFLTSYKDYLIVGENDVEFNKYFLDDQKNLIMIHLYHITEMLSHYFTDNHIMFKRKIRLCYEKCFYNRIGRDLILLYRIAYAEDIQSLKKRMFKLKQVEICKLGLQIKKEWWLSLFESDENMTNADSSVDDVDYVSSMLEESDDLFSDFDEEEYYTSDHKPYLKQMDSIKTIKKSIKKSKEKVLSRSMNNGVFLEHEGTSSDLIRSGSKLLKEDVASKTVKSAKHEDQILTCFEENAPAHSPIILRKCRNSISNKPNNGSCVVPESITLHEEFDTFEVHFGAAISTIKSIFSHFSPLKKMQCLTTALRMIVNKVEELRMRDNLNPDRLKIAVSADDLLPLLVLIFLKMAPNDVAKIYVELLFISDLMAEFLSSGCHSYALCEFQIAFRVLDQTCEELFLL